MTEERIQAWADEAERGYDVPALRRRGRPPKGDGAGEVVTVRVDVSLLAAVDLLAKRGHVSRSDVIRDALRDAVSAAPADASD